MGLDLVVEGAPRDGQEAEWRRLLQRGFDGDHLTDAEVARFQEISVPGYERLGAPRVGYDKAADDWIIETRKAATAQEAASVLKEFHGYHALRLVKSDGLPEYSHGGCYDGVDETSFRGAFLEGCEDVLSNEAITRAWDHKLPEAAIDYGRELLAAAQAAGASGPVSKPPPPKPGFFSWLIPAKRPMEPIPFDEQLKIVEAAGRWFIFWGERGHAIRAWF
jgi:hypothetical protein